MVTLSFLARPEGFEPPAFGIGIHCDIQLRHGRKCGSYAWRTSIGYCTLLFRALQEVFYILWRLFLLSGAQPQGDGGDVVGVVLLGVGGVLDDRLHQGVHISLVGRQNLLHRRQTAAEGAVADHH